MTPRTYQIPAIRYLATTRRGILQAPAGSGKTVIAAAALADCLERRGGVCKVAVLCNTIEQVGQWVEAFKAFPIIAQKAEVDIGCAAGDIDPAGCDLLIVDECHHAGAASWASKIRCAKKGRWGLSATPFGPDDERNAIVRELFTDRIHEVKRDSLVEHGHLAKAAVRWIGVLPPEGFTQRIHELATELIEKRRRKMPPWFFTELESETTLLFEERRKENLRLEKIKEEIDLQIAEIEKLFKTDESENRLKRLQKHEKSTSKRIKRICSHIEQVSQCKWQAVQQVALWDNEARDALIVRQTNELLSHGHHVIVLIGKIEHGERLVPAIPGAVLCYSKMGRKRRAAAIEDFKRGAVRCLISTSCLEEGFDAPIADCIIMASAGKSFRKAVQSTGRVLRRYEGKERGVIIDFLDGYNPMLARQAQKRRGIYRDLRYEQA